MLYRDIFTILGFYLLCFAGILLIPLGIAAYFEFFVDPSLHPQPHSTLAFFWTILISLAAAIILIFLGKKPHSPLFRREGLIIVASIWFLTPAIGAFPFYLSGTFDKYLPSFFEAASGFSTTGISMMESKQYDPVTEEEIPIVRTYCGLRTVTYTYYGTITPILDKQTGKVLIEGIEAVSQAVLFWRSMMQWLGGLGIIVLFVALLPALGVGGKMLLQAELPGPIKDALTPRIKETAMALWKIYLFLSVLEFITLLSINPEMTWFEAITLTFSTLSTGGFSVHSTSVGYYQDNITEWVIILFMIAGGTNFAHYYSILKGKFYRIYEPEFAIYLFLLTIGAFFIASDILGIPKFSLGGIEEGVFSLRESIRYGVFQLVSAQTSTGFTTYDYTSWPFLSQALMLIFMYFGGMSGSTAGGMKVIRQFILFRVVQDKVEHIFRPETVRSIKIGMRTVDQNTLITVLCYFVITISFAVLGTLLYVMDGIDPQTALGLVTCNINNIGISFYASGPSYSAAFLAPFSQIVSIILMILGRLEFFAILVLLVPAFWQEMK